MITASTGGVILCVGDYAPGSTSDPALLRSSKQDIGLAARCRECKSRAIKCYECGGKGF